MVIALSQHCAKGDILTPLSKSDLREWESYSTPARTSLGTRFQQKKLALWAFLLERKLGINIPKNLSATLAKQYLGEHVWNSYFKFCFERNPFDKAVSLYYWSTRHIHERPEINAYIQSMPASKLSNWDRYTIDGKIAVNLVARFENLDQELERIANRLGLPRLSLPKAKGKSRNNDQHYSQLLDRQSRAWIETACAREIEIFDYSWNQL